MKAASQIELFNLIEEITKDRVKAERIVTLVVDETDETEELKRTFPTKEDFSALELRMTKYIDTKIWQLVGAIFVMLSLVVAIIKLL